MNKAKLWLMQFASIYAMNVDAGLPWFTSVRSAVKGANKLVRRMQTPGA